MFTWLFYSGKQTKNWLKSNVLSSGTFRLTMNQWIKSQKKGKKCSWDSFLVFNSRMENKIIYPSGSSFTSWQISFTGWSLDMKLFYFFWIFPQMFSRVEIRTVSWSTAEAWHHPHPPDNRGKVLFFSGSHLYMFHSTCFRQKLLHHLLVQWRSVIHHRIPLSPNHPQSMSASLSLTVTLFFSVQSLIMDYFSGFKSSFLLLASNGSLTNID